MLKITHIQYANISSWYPYGGIGLIEVPCFTYTGKRLYIYSVAVNAHSQRFWSTLKTTNGNNAMIRFQLSPWQYVLLRLHSDHASKLILHNTRQKSYPVRWTVRIFIGCRAGWLIKIDCSPAKPNRNVLAELSLHHIIVTFHTAVSWHFFSYMIEPRQCWVCTQVLAICLDDSMYNIVSGLQNGHLHHLVYVKLYKLTNSRNIFAQQINWNINPDYPVNAGITDNASNCGWLAA